MAKRCGHTVGPVPKLDGEVLVCELPAEHRGDHEGQGAWWVESAGRANPGAGALCAALAGLIGWALVLAFFGLLLFGASVDWWQ